MAENAVELHNVTKCFSKVIANDDVSLKIGKGEVVALLGENGAGKSTIMKILYGLYSMDEGRIVIDGKEVRIKSPKDAISHGIAMIQQHFSLVFPHTVTENIVLGNVHGWLDLKEAKEKVGMLAKKYGFPVPLDARVGDLAVGVQQKVEILKALYLDARILIMDEPTAVLTPQEAESLVSFIRSYAADGNSVVFITHKMKEVMESADRIIVMRNGRITGNVLKSETNERELARMMMGEELEVESEEEPIDVSNLPVSIEVVDARKKNRDGIAVLDGVSFSVHKGEIFGIAGVSGNGQDEICEAISGNMKLDGGKIIFEGKDITNESVRKRIEEGIGYVPVDRYKDGMVMEMTLSENMMLKSSYSEKWVKNGFIDKKGIDEYTDEVIRDYQVKATGHSDIAHNLSGGNQQKVVLAREIDAGRHAIIFNQPTRGLDIGAVDRIHRAIKGEKRKGKAVVVVSTELTEIFELSDRICVMYRGKIMGIYNRGELTTGRIGLLMAGVEDGKA